MAQALMINLRPDPARAILRPLIITDAARVSRIIDRVLALDPETAASLLTDVRYNFRDRHRDLLGRFEERADMLVHGVAVSQIQRQLIGSYFLQEYTFEGVALFNPSIVPHPDQSDAPAGGLRFILSLRAVGEGHISSLVFRTGTIAADGGLTVDPAAVLAATPRIGYQVDDDVEVVFKPGSDISERVIFPVTGSHSHGIEDARFVRFSDGAYYATYTAYSGAAICSELIETRDFLSFRMAPLHGPAVCNKGMALFPREVNGRYAMVVRHDNENLYLVYSDDLYTWGEGQLILKPQYPWEFAQIEIGRAHV